MKSSATPKPHSPWITALLALIVIALAIPVIRTMTGEDHAKPSPPSPAKSEHTLIGRWQRTDAAYILDIRSVAADGTLDAAYLNPRSINVSKAKSSRDNNKTTIFVELQDVGYPGSTYTLTYSADADKLSGQYFQAAVGQTFDIEFVRMK
jgi:hypothetical protein